MHCADLSGKGTEVNRDNEVKSSLLSLLPPIQAIPNSRPLKTDLLQDFGIAYLLA
jgi:hypothetical protein